MSALRKMRRDILRQDAGNKDLRKAWRTPERMAAKAKAKEQRPARIGEYPRGLVGWLTDTLRKKRE